MATSIFPIGGFEARLIAVERRPDRIPAVAGDLHRAAAAADDARAGRARPIGTIGSFTVVAELGRGAAARVFRVRRDGAPGAPEYALKVLDPGAAGLAAGLAALRREAALLAGVDHPGLATIHEVGEDAGRPYVVMDLVEGRTLAAVLATGPMPPGQVIALARDLAGPLAAVHRHGLMHRDLKPDNIMMLPHGRARLIDFGLAGRQSVTGSPTAAGTLLYASPEQTGVLRRAPDHRCDLYSLGAVLFECLTGGPPFVADEVADLLRMHAAAPVPDLRELVPGIPPGLAEVVTTLLAKDPDDRYDGAVQLAADLVRIERAPGGPFTPRRVAPRWQGAARHPLRGRSGDMARLTARWTAARAGEGGLWLVGGPTGVGTSRLVAELAALAEGEGALVLHGRAGADDAMPLAPLRVALQGHALRAQRLPPAERERAVSRLVRAAGPHLGLLITLAPALARVLAEGTAAVEPGARRGAVRGPVTEDQDQFALAVATMLLRLARPGEPVLLVLDDAQWLDPATRRVLTHLAAEADGVPLLALLAGRTDGPAPLRAPVTGRGPGPDLSLGPLPASAIADLVRTALPGADVGPRLAQLLTARSAGSPFIAHEYLQAIVDAGLLRPHWGRWSLDEAGLEALHLPRDTVGLVLARLRKLRPATQDVLSSAAVAGTRFRTGSVAAAGASGDGEVLTAVAEGIAYGLVEPRGEGVYTFVHDGVRRALLDRLDAAEAALRHRRVADTLESALDGGPGVEPELAGRAEDDYAVARHRLAGGPEHAPQRAFDACWRAGLQALRGCAPAEAVEYFGQAASIAEAAGPEGVVVRRGFGRDRGLALQRNGDLGEARRVLQEALDVEEDPVARAEILAVTAQVYCSSWLPREGVAAVRRGLAELGAPLPRTRAGLVLSTLWCLVAAQIMQWTGWGYGSARGEDRRRYRLIINLHRAGAYCCLLSGWFSWLLIYNVRVPYWGNRIGGGTLYVRGQAGLALCCLQLGRRAAATRVFARLRADPSCRDDPVLQAELADCEGAARYFAGDDDGESLADALLQHGRWLDTPTFRDGCDALALHALNAGRTEHAVRWLDASGRRLASGAEEANSPAHYLTLAVLEAVRGRPAPASLILRQAAAGLPADSPPGILEVQRLAELIVLREQDETGEPFDRAVDAFEALGIGRVALLRMHRVAYFHLVMGRLTQFRRGADGERAVRLKQARAALGQLHRMPRDGDLRALERVARADLLVATGRPRVALRVLAEALGGSGELDPHDVPMAAY
ncbi:MAG TPA: AAA family ATPase, partial [Kineosporiaceae bacterium]